MRLLIPFALGWALVACSGDHISEVQDASYPAGGMDDPASAPNMLQGQWQPHSNSQAQWQNPAPQPQWQGRMPPSQAQSTASQGGGQAGRPGAAPAANQPLPQGVVELKGLEIIDRNGFEKQVLASTILIPNHWQGQG
ncbi:MAG: hypothetical protein ACK5HY_09090, partial [Parahaliea sp.]